MVMGNLFNDEIDYSEDELDYIESIRKCNGRED